MVNGILYFTIPDHVFAINARTGEQLWQYDFEDKGGHLVGQRGVGMYGNWLYFLTPDGWFISLNAKDGKERWRKKIADEKLQYFTTMAPMIVKNHVIVGVGGDAMDVRGYLESRDPETGELQWRWWSDAREAGRSGLGDLAESRRDGPRRRHDVAARHLRSRAESALLGHRQRQPGFRRAEPQGRESLDRVDRRAESRHRASWCGISRPRRTTRTIGTTSKRPCCSTPSIDGKPRKLLAQGARARLVLRARSDERQEPGLEAILRNGQLGERRRCERPADSRSRERAEGRWLA